MVVNYIAFAVPAFMGGIALEYVVAKRRGKPVYRLADALTSMGAGITQQACLLLFGATLLAAYAHVYAHWRLVTFAPGSVWPWVLGFVGVDFLYYWWHRWSHEVNFLWAVHVVHHQSEDYNLATALRQAVLSNLTIWPLYVLLAFVGVPLGVYVASASFSLLYQFWIHTELIDKLGPVEGVLNTPSAHRVHHAINPRYIDRNYAATLMCWDRLFRTYEPETEAPVYGITKRFKRFNPLLSQTDGWQQLWREARMTPRWADKVGLFFRSPAWHAPGTPDTPPLYAPRERFVKHDVAPVSRATAVYVLVHFTLLVVGTGLFMLYAPRLGFGVKALGVVAVLASLGSLSSLLEGRKHARVVEVARVALIVLAAGALAWAGPALLQVA